LSVERFRLIAGAASSGFLVWAICHAAAACPANSDHIEITGLSFALVALIWITLFSTSTITLAPFFVVITLLPFVLELAAVLIRNVALSWAAVATLVLAVGDLAREER
jgi:hypothetical protein